MNETLARIEALKNTIKREKERQSILLTTTGNGPVLQEISRLLDLHERELALLEVSIHSSRGL